MTIINNINCKTIVRPMRTTFATARGAKTSIISVIVNIVCDDGTVGSGEVPTSFVVPHETPEVIKRSIRRSKTWLCGRDVSEWALISGELKCIFPDFHMTCSGLEVAMFRAYLVSTGSKESKWWGGKLGRIHTDITIPFIPDIESLRPWVQNAVKLGFDVYKVKISGDVDQDIAFVHSVSEMLSELERPCTIRLDGNQGFTCNSALKLLDQLHCQIDLFEQPLKSDDYEGMKQLCKRSPVPIVADETVFSVNDSRRVIENGLAHGINIKIAKSGITGSRQIIHLAKQAKLKLMLGCMTETLTGLSAAIYCAMGTDAFDYIDLDSIHFLRRNRRYQDIVVDGPEYSLGDAK